MLFLALREREGEGSRARIMEILRRSPGMNKIRLCQSVGLSRATVTYHLKVLQGEGTVDLQRQGRDVYCFPVNIPTQYRPWLTVLHDDKAKKVLEALGPEEAGVRQLALQLGLSESATRRRLERMRLVGMVRKRGRLRPRFARQEGQEPPVP